jgi:hypothetical protein
MSPRAHCRDARGSFTETARGVERLGSLVILGRDGAGMALKSEEASSDRPSGSKERRSVPQEIWKACGSAGVTRKVLAELGPSIRYGVPSSAAKTAFEEAEGEKTAR